MGAPARTRERTLAGNRDASMADTQPPSLAKANQIHPPSQIVDRDNQVGQIGVDFQVFHVLSCCLPIGQRDVGNPVGKQRLHEALAPVIVSDHCRMSCMGRGDQRGKTTVSAVLPQHHGAQIEPYLIGRGKVGAQVLVNPGVFFNELEVPHKQLSPLLPKRRGHGHWPECRHARQRQLGSSDRRNVGHEKSLCAGSL